MDKERTTYIDVWSNIKITLRKFSPIESFILIATKGYGHSIRQISKILEMSPIDIKKIIKKLERAIRKDLKGKGANLKRITHMDDSDFIVECDETQIEEGND